MKNVTCARNILHYSNNYYLQITSDPLLAILFQQ
ncbi:glutamate decarboxylase, partial [Escherichia coli]|nr:glutamate decarboxylase [Escherichia coli]